jgi:hypothetical protein
MSGMTKADFFLALRSCTADGLDNDPTPAAAAVVLAEVDEAEDDVEVSSPSQSFSLQNFINVVKAWTHPIRFPIALVRYRYTSSTAKVVVVNVS